MNIEAVPKPVNPELIDKPIGVIQDCLNDNLSWLDHSFGKSQRLAEIQNKKKRFFPGVWINSLGRYINVFPDQELGNFSFFTLDGPESIDSAKGRSFFDVTCKISIIFWFDLSSIFESSKDRDLEAVKKQILNVLVKSLVLSNARFEVHKVYERYEKIYADLDIDNFRSESQEEIKSQMLMQPYAGLRFEGNLKFIEAC